MSESARRPTNTLNDSTTHYSGKHYLNARIVEKVGQKPQHAAAVANVIRWWYGIGDDDGMEREKK